jgi:hypothetical protein
MDKNTLSQYGWVIICIIVIAVMIALASPFGEFIKESILSTVFSFDQMIADSLKIKSVNESMQNDVNDLLELLDKMQSLLG